MSKEGKLWTAYTSTDGKAWNKVAERILKRDWPEFNVGIVFGIKPPGHNKTLFSGRLGNISIVNKAFADTNPQPQSLEVSKGQFVGVVSDPQSETTIYARTAGNGMLKSIDGGQNFESTRLPQHVRSIAVMPSEPSVLLAGIGYGSNTGLWRSTDSGSTWSKVSDAIDFDGQSKDVLYGETISFDPHNPGNVAAAGKASGLYISNDKGMTWNYAGLKGEHITVVAFSPYYKNLLIVATAGTKTTPGRIY